MLNFYYILKKADEKIGLVFYTDVSILKNGFTSFEVMTIIRGI